MVCCYVPGLRRTRNPTHLTAEAGWALLPSVQQAIGLGLCKSSAEAVKVRGDPS